MLRIKFTRFNFFCCFRYLRPISFSEHNCSIQSNSHLHHTSCDMSKSKKDKIRSTKKGLGPGSLVHVGEERSDKVKIKLIDYNSDSIREQEITSFDQCNLLSQTNTVSWIDIDGIHDPKIIEEIGAKFNIHILVLEDVMNSTTRPKVEFFDDYMFISLKMLELNQDNELNSEQLSLIAGKNYLLMFQERRGDSFDAIRERVRTAKGKVRGKNAHYLAYLILDVVIDNYISVSEKFATEIENLEERVLQSNSETTLRSILEMRKELLDFKRSIDPLKEAINTITRELDDDMSKYYRDLHDHIVYESENLAMYREMIVNLIDLYHSSLSVKMNQVMKVLTVITTIFVPLTFIVGIYGMNFDNMPELHWQNGYFIVMGLMLVIVIFMLNYFRKKKWL